MTKNEPIRTSITAIRFSFALKEVESQTSELKSVMARHQSYLNSGSAIDRRYREREIKDGRIRLCSLSRLCAELEAKMLVFSSEPQQPSRRADKSEPKQKHKEADDTHELLVTEKDFFQLFFADLEQARDSVEILSPFVSSHRVDVLQKLAELVKRGRKCFLYTRPPTKEHEKSYVTQAESQGLQVLQRNDWHHKVAIIDDQICWEGSLNITSHSSSRDTMRRLVGRKYATEYRQLLGLIALP
ncbi:MAG TPA: phospholipase D-like domain-containing protein [Oculatellaceae cyanobacterium]